MPQSQTQAQQSFLIPLDKVIKKLRRSRYVQEIFLHLLESEPPVRKWWRSYRFALWIFAPRALEKYALVHYYELLKAGVLEEYKAVNPKTGRRVMYIRWDPKLIRNIVRSAVKPGERPWNIIRGVTGRDTAQCALLKAFLNLWEE